MIKLILIAFGALSVSVASPQQSILVFKKRNKTITRFWQSSIIAFQSADKEWHKGEITGIQNDSFYIKPRIVHYNLMNTDTIYFPIEGFSLADVFAMPKEGFLIDYINGRFQISRSGGHVHWYWVKSGWIFRVGAAGYEGLYLINGIRNNDLSLKGSKLGIVAGIFAGGVLLHKLYSPTLKVRKKYRLEILRFSK